MCEGLRSQVVLGLILEQYSELLILDDYSMGLDAGYRRLFVDFLREHLKDGKHTVILTSHVIQDMNRFVDNVVFLRRGGQAHVTRLDDFMRNFVCYRLNLSSLTQDGRKTLSKLASGLAGHIHKDIVNIEEHPEYFDIFSFKDMYTVTEALSSLNVDFGPIMLRTISMDVEDAFVGYTGRR